METQGTGDTDDITVADDVGLPAGWVKTTISDVTRGGVEQSNPSGETLVYIDISSIDNKTKRITEPKTILSDQAPSRARQMLCTGDVLVSMTRPNLNAVAFVPPSLDGAIGSTGFDVLRAPDICPQYLFHLVQSTAFVEVMSALVQGALYPAVRPKDIRTYRFNLAPLPEQVRLVARIEELTSQIDAGTAGLRDVRQKLKRYRASLLKAACEGTLVPTEADLAQKENRPYEPAHVLLARILTERRARWEADQLEKMRTVGKEPKDDKWKARYGEPAAPDTSGLPPLPEGWTWATVEQISLSVRYGSSAKTDGNAEGIPVLRMGNIQNGKIDWNNLKYLPQEHSEFPDLLMTAGELLFNRTNSAELVGKTAVYKGHPAPVSFASYLIGVRLNEECLPDYLNCFINSSFGRAWVASVVTQQVGQANVNGTKLQALAVPLPPLAEQGRIVAEVELHLSVIDQMEAALSANLKRADRLRQAVLRDAFAGKLVPQDPSDEPASVFLERIKAEREKTETSSGRRQQRKLR